MLEHDVHKDVVYFRDYQDARLARDAFLPNHAGCRVVRYERGYAVQREKSGPYLAPGLYSPGTFRF